MKTAAVAARSPGGATSDLAKALAEAHANKRAQRCFHAKAAAARKITVTNTPSVFTEDTADLAMALIIGVPRRIREADCI